MSENNNAPAATTIDTPAATTTPAATDTPVTTVATPPVEQQPGATDNPPADNPEPEVLLGGEQPPAADQPIQYTDFTLPEGFELDGDDSKALLELGQQFKMPQEAVQKLVDLGVQMQQRQVAQQQQMVRSWIDATRADAEYGGEKLQQSLLTAQKAFTLPRGDKISKLLGSSGLGNHPDVIGFMTEVGKLLQPDNIVHGQGANTGNVSPASVWYDKS
ncbi:hypothetical protein ACINWC323_2670 [Acinetobacter sp. WC-323]|uniref:hypothetical protein n=1 Tax=Acinetobacter sp. WC-323 TaxID=903918 RepID=UPI00029E01AF|nr:hypothetical protein [Acinetobacter sp. WC-323]EKU56667.1 hypothetical protein ACINWC323_2670 [Acinetobacter sp. WC-323]